MTLEASVHAFRLRVIARAQTLGNVSQVGRSSTDTCPPWMCLASSAQSSRVCPRRSASTSAFFSGLPS